MAFLSQLLGDLKLCAVLVFCLTVTVASESSANAADVSFLNVDQGQVTVTDTLAPSVEIGSWIPSTFLPAESHVKVAEFSPADNANRDHPKFISVPTPHVVTVISMGVPKYVTFWNSTTFASATALNTSTSCTSLAYGSSVPVKSTPSTSNGTAQWVTATSAPSIYPDFADEESMSLALIQAAVDGIIPIIKHRDAMTTTSEARKVTTTTHTHTTSKCEPLGVSCLPAGMIGRDLDKATHTSTLTIPKVTTPPNTVCTYANHVSCLPLGEQRRDASTPAFAAAEETGILVRKVHHHKPAKVHHSSSTSSSHTTAHTTTPRPLTRIFGREEHVADTSAITADPAPIQISGHDVTTPAPAAEESGIQVRKLLHDIGNHHNNSSNSTTGGSSSTIATARSPLAMLLLTLMLGNLA